MTHEQPQECRADFDWLNDARRLRELKPKRILFLCVANSARSQMAEGIARKLAPVGVIVSSAGSEPTSVRPEAAQVLMEIGIDISGHSATSVNDIDTGTVDAVITLCAQEVCPTFLGDAVRVHWGLPDPAAVRTGTAKRLRAFRDVRDTLLKRLEVVFSLAQQ